MFSSKKKSDRATQEKHQATSLFGSGSTFNGSVEAANDLRIDGKVIGSVEGKSKVVTGESSVVEGPMSGVTIEIHGQVHGDITVTDTLVLRPTAVIEGNIFAAKLTMEEGARINGQIQVGDTSKAIKLNDTPMKLHTNGSDKVAAVG